MTACATPAATMAYVNAASLLPGRKRIGMDSVAMVISEKEKTDAGDGRKVNSNLLNATDLPKLSDRITSAIIGENQ